VLTIDIIISIILLAGIVRGFLKGFIYEISILGIIVISYFFGFELAEITSKFLSKMISANPTTLHYISLLVVWIGVSIGIFFLARLLEGLVKIVALGIFNKIAGAVLGFIKYTFLLSVFLYFFNKVDFTTSWLNAEKKSHSIFYYKVLKIAPGIYSVLK
jgi:membrane protein required for colicin V production